MTARLMAILAMAVVIGASAIVATTRKSRTAIVALWFGQFGAGALLLACGSETVALLVWMVATIVAAISFLHADVVGDPPAPAPKGAAASAARLVFPGLVSTGVGVMSWLLLAGLVEGPGSGSTPASAPGVQSEERFLLLELLALLALAAAIGAGVISRPRRTGAGT